MRDETTIAKAETFVRKVLSEDMKVKASKKTIREVAAKVAKALPPYHEKDRVTAP